MLRAGNRLMAALQVVLILGITAGVGPGSHTCGSQTSPHVSGPRVESALDAHHLEHGDVLCFACLVRAQFSSLNLTVVPRVLPPRQSVAVDTSQVSLPTISPRVHCDVRAPPNASSDSSTA